MLSMHAIDWFVPMLSNLVDELAPIAFIIFGVTSALDFFMDAVYGRRIRRL